MRGRVCLVYSSLLLPPSFLSTGHRQLFIGVAVPQHQRNRNDYRRNRHNRRREHHRRSDGRKCSRAKGEQYFGIPPFRQSLITPFWQFAVPALLERTLLLLCFVQEMLINQLLTVFVVELGWLCSDVRNHLTTSLSEYVASLPILVIPFEEEN